MTLVGFSHLGRDVGTTDLVGIRSVTPYMRCIVWIMRWHVERHSSTSLHCTCVSKSSQTCDFMLFRDMIRYSILKNTGINKN